MASDDKFQSFESTILDDLIAAPLVALANANGALAARQIALLLEQCFHYNKETGVFAPIEVTMVVTRAAFPAERKGDKLELEQIQAKFKVALISLIPISSLCVKDFDANFAIEVTDFELTSRKSKQPDPDVKRHPFLRASAPSGPATRLYGRIAERPTSSHAASIAFDVPRATIDLQVRSGDLPLSEGLKMLLRHYNFSQDPVEVSSEPAEGASR